MITIVVVVVVVVGILSYFPPLLLLLIVSVVVVIFTHTFTATVSTVIYRLMGPNYYYSLLLYLDARTD